MGRLIASRPNEFKTGTIACLSLRTLGGIGTLERIAAIAKEHTLRVVPQAAEGTCYRFRLDDASSFPDPASRYQPDGPLS